MFARLRGCADSQVTGLPDANDSVWAKSEPRRSSALIAGEPLRIRTFACNAWRCSRHCAGMVTKTKLRKSVQRRLLPLHLAAFLQGVLLWLPVEKLFMTEIGFNAATTGVMAAVYAAVVPIVEVPSGILADRWSRRGVLVVSSVALTLVSLLGGLSQNVVMYMLSAVVLGVYFAMYSGTMESVVYDT